MKTFKELIAENSNLYGNIPSSIVVKGIKNVDFEVRYIPKGSRHGRTNSLVAKEALVEFYDSRTKQFISSYYVDTIMDIKGSSGLNLNSSIPSWAIPAKSLNKVIDWIGDIKVYDS